MSLSELWSDVGRGWSLGSSIREQFCVITSTLLLPLPRSHHISPQARMSCLESRIHDWQNILDLTAARLAREQLRTNAEVLSDTEVPRSVSRIWRWTAAVEDLGPEELSVDRSADVPSQLDAATTDTKTSPAEIEQPLTFTDCAVDPTEQKAKNKSSQKRRQRAKSRKQAEVADEIAGAEVTEAVQERPTMTNSEPSSLENAAVSECGCGTCGKTLIQSGMMITPEEDLIYLTAKTHDAFKDGRGPEALREMAEGVKGKTLAGQRLICAGERIWRSGSIPARNLEEDTDVDAPSLVLDEADFDACLHPWHLDMDTFEGRAWLRGKFAERDERLFAGLSDKGIATICRGMIQLGSTWHVRMWGALEFRDIMVAETTQGCNKCRSTPGRTESPLTDAHYGTTSEADAQSAGDAPTGASE